MTNPTSLLMIPGPVELTPEVQAAAGANAMSHVAPAFIKTFSRLLVNLRTVFQAGSAAQPFVIAGSGTLGWDQVASNLLEPGQKALVINTGYFGDRFAECLTAYGAKVAQLAVEHPGTRPSLEALTAFLSQHQDAKMVTMTHVDTSTAVLADVKGYAGVIRQQLPQALIVVDGVCAVASEEMRMQEWDIDVVLTASQKALGAPPGLSVLMASERAMHVFHHRQTPVLGYYASWQRWLPIMRAYEEQRPSYFATPAVQLVQALDVSVEQMLAVGMPQVWAHHVQVSQHVKQTLQSWGLRFVPTSLDVSANGMTAVYFPDGVDGPALLKHIAEQGIVLAGGLHQEIGKRYMRIGHMGVTALRETDLGYVQRTLDAVAAALNANGYAVPSS